jgi:GNAT superfamily N-acetyltransferase
MIVASATDFVRGVAGYGLPGVTPALPRAALDDCAWETVLANVVRHRVTGHLVRAIHDGTFPATEDQQAAAVDAHERALALALMLERLLLTTVAQLHAVKVTARVLRGPAVAHAVYPEPGLRSFGDIDLLVAPRDYDTAVTLLCSQGARRRYPEPRHGFDRRFGKGVCLETPSGLEIDLHRTFVAGPFGLAVNTDMLFGSSTKFSLGGQVLDGLDPEGRFLDACFHAALGDEHRRLVPLRDVAQMTICAGLDAARVRELCRVWRCGIVVQRAIGLAWDAFALDTTNEVVRWAREHECSAFERQALQAYVGSDSSYARQTVAGLWALHSVRAKVAYAAALLVPTRPYVRTRDGGYGRRAGRAVRLFLDDRARGRQQASGAARYGSLRPRMTTAVEDDVTIRPATASDRPSVLGLLEASLGWGSDECYAEFFAWKHEQSPFGPSPAWVAVDRDGGLLGFRTFLRWEFARGRDVVRAARAVDTATRPDAQRRGIFSRLTRTAIESLLDENIAFVFNTPNQQSIAGYIRMGWQRVGRLPVSARASPDGHWTRLVGARRRPANRWSLPSAGGVPASDALAARAPVERLLTGLRTKGLHTRLSVEYLRWRYGFPALGYRIVSAGPTVEDGAAVFRLRRRGRAVEAVIADVLVPGDERKLRGELCRRVLTVAGADYAIRVGRPRSAGGFLPLPGQGPILTWRALVDTTMPTLREWDLSLGDVELF